VRPCIRSREEGDTTWAAAASQRPVAAFFSQHSRTSHVLARSAERHAHDAHHAACLPECVFAAGRGASFSGCAHRIRVVDSAHSITRGRRLPTSSVFAAGRGASSSGCAHRTRVVARFSAQNHARPPIANEWLIMTLRIFITVARIASHSAQRSTYVSRPSARYTYQHAATAGEWLRIGSPFAARSRRGVLSAPMISPLQCRGTRHHAQLPLGASGSASAVHSRFAPRVLSARSRWFRAPHTHQHAAAGEWAAYPPLIRGSPRAVLRARVFSLGSARRTRMTRIHRLPEVGSVWQRIRSSLPATVCWARHMFSLLQRGARTVTRCRRSQRVAPYSTLGLAASRVVCSPALSAPSLDRSPSAAQV